MKLTYLGTAAAEGWPAIFCDCAGCIRARELKGKNIRTRSQALINDDLLLDFCCDTYMHILNYGLDIDRVKDILITHSHEDHFYMDDIALRQDGYSPVRQGHVLNLYGNEDVAKKYREAVEIDYNTSLPSSVSMTTLSLYTKTNIGKYVVYPLRADHKQGEECMIYLIIDKVGKTVLYAHDTGIFHEEVFEFLKDFKLDLVSLDCTSGKQNGVRNHMGIESCEKVKNRLIEQGSAKEGTKFILNHFSHNSMYLDFDELERDAEKRGFLVSYDRMEIEV